MTCSRRQFLSACCSSALVLGASPLLVSCSAGRPAPRSPPPLDRLDPATARILWYAALAPSGHNSQPWEVTLISPTHWRIGIPPERRLPAVDPHGRETLISLGAFVENLAQAAATQGLAAEVQVMRDDPLCRDIIDLHLVSGPVALPDCLERMQRRRVVKKGHRPQRLSAGDTLWLEKLWPGQLYYLARGSAEASRLSEGTVTSMAEQCQREEAMREFAQWVRFGRESRDTHRDGLTTAGMEIDGIAGWFVDHLYRAEDVLKPSFLKQTMDVTARLAGEGAGWLVLCSPGTTPAELIGAGREFQRMFLSLRERNIACHPMSQMFEEKAGRDELSALFGAGQIPQMLLRVGYRDSYPDPVSLRRPPHWFVTEN